MNRKPATKPKRQPVALAALKRASQQALELARQTKTPAWVIEDGKLVDATRPQRKSRKRNDDV
ncbi:MAG: hypothetical protein ABL888_00785 [Pirellulaceae bacterium]|jgi:hypothetical protein